MSASPTNTGLELKEENGLSLESAQPVKVSSPPEPLQSRDALQALLAFSSLHEQIRVRRARELSQDARLSSRDAWDLEQFVLDEVLQLVAERALTITGADGVAIALAEGNEIICRASAGEIAPDAGARLNPSSGFSGACFRTGKIVRCDDAESDPRVNVQAARRLGARAMVAVPLAARHGVIGLLEAFSYEAHGFDDSDVRSLNLLAELILAAMRPEEEDRLAEISQRVAVREGVISEAPTETVAEAKSAPATVLESSTEIEDAPPAESTLPAEPAKTSRPGQWVVLLVVLIGVLLGGGVWWRIRHKALAVPPATPATPQAAPANSVPAEEPPAVPQPSSPSEAQSGTLPQVTGVRHWSSDETSTVVIDLQDQVQYEAHRLSNPERIYFDLYDTVLAPGLMGKSIEVGDKMISRVRIAQPVAGVTRVVLETKGGSNFSVSLEANPYRIVVEVRGIGTAARPKAKVDLFAPPAPAAAAPTPTVRAKADVPRFRLVLDAGHGGWDLGTVGRKGLLEKDLTLDIVDRLGKLVESRLKTEVVYTRQDDNYIALEKRAEVANQAQADLFLSVHANYSDLTSARGVETYYTNTFSSVNAHSHDAPDAASVQPVSFANVDIKEKVTQSHKLAAAVQQALFKMLSAKHPGVRNRGVKEASYVVLTGTTMPAILAEVSFVSSPTDESNLQNDAYRQQIAEALYQGLVKYVSANYKMKLASASSRAGAQ
jgi:N-acetylmuramoyl-L-alanine amidase/putative methionine-R-sulfoxide reductase with GAF domain